jgi:quinol monooxygenase YgiN
MIHVIASIYVKEKSLSEYLSIFKSNVTNVLQEEGCISYVPALDTPANLPPQLLEPQVVTILEAWESVEALHAHLQTPHMKEYNKKTKDMVEKVVIKVLKEA